MLGLLVISSIAALAHCIADTTGFDPVKSPAAKVILANVTKDNIRACQIDCADNEPQCTSLSYTFPNCVLLGDNDDGATCGKMMTFSTKVARSTVKVDRNYPSQDLDPFNDPCIDFQDPVNTRMNQNGICVRDDRNIVIRAITEAGVRVTIDNDIDNFVAFIAARNMWQLFYATGESTWLVALLCVTTKPSCTCDPLPNMDPARFGIPDGVTSAYGGPTACADTTYQLTYWAYKFGPNSDYGSMTPDEAAKTQLKCEAGIWLLNYIDGSNGFQVTNATCNPLPTPTPPAGSCPNCS